jgi:hypothetical protein
MNMKAHLLEVAEEDLEDAKSFENSDPQKSLKFMISRYEALAAYYLANSNDSYVESLDEAIELKLKYASTYGIFPSEQIDYIFLSLANGAIVTAKEIAAIPTNYEGSHSFSIQLNCKLRELLGAPVLIECPDYNPTKSEVGLFQAIDNLISKTSVDWGSLGKYWSATKSKRYHLTLFEDVDLFSKALKYVQQSI